MLGAAIAAHEASGLLVAALASAVDRQALRRAAESLGFGGAPLEDDALIARLVAGLAGGRLRLRCLEEAPRYRGRTRELPAPPDPPDPDDFDRPPSDHEHWVEVVLVDGDGRGISGQRYTIVTPDGIERSGYTDSLGAARLDRIAPGDCTVVFPDLGGESM